MGHEHFVVGIRAGVNICKPLHDKLLLLLSLSNILIKLFFQERRSVVANGWFGLHLLLHIGVVLEHLVALINIYFGLVSKIVGDYTLDRS